jgi:hypothetical protein
MIAQIIVTIALWAMPMCMPGAFESGDMAGVYEAVDIQVIVGPCGGIGVQWANDYGLHEAGYYGIDRLIGGGIIAGLTDPDPYVRSLDGRNTVAIKPAEVGYVQVVTIDATGKNLRVYRLRKVQ